MDKIHLIFKDAIFVVSFTMSILLFVLPYYFLLPEGSYIPKRIPAWLFLIGALIFLVIAIVRVYVVSKRKVLETQ